ncbi:bacteriophage protein, partial [Klebsiella pneumoniae]|uniref:DUF1367 family protein n=1 Tax=Klebsiella pneumoniae TaxID=573 RepID=UPI0028762BE3
MAQYSFIKSAGDVLIPASPDAREFVKKIRLGAVLYSDFKQARNPAFHRKFFALLNLGFDYWQPSGGEISPADKKLVRGYVQLVAHYAGHGDTLQELADQ